MGRYTVGEAARIARVTVRTLHHYDAVGLLCPGVRSEAGYRLYTDDDLHRLYQILFYREVGFPLDEIRDILARPNADEDGHLHRQRERLLADQARIAAMLDAVNARLSARQQGRALSMEDQMHLFGAWSDEPYEEEVRERWGNTNAYRESARRTRQYTAHDWATIQAEAHAIDEAWVAALQDGAPADDPIAMAVAERHRQHLSRWFYDCPPASHRALGEMYGADERFRARYEALAPGLAAYVREALAANAARQERERR